MITSISACTRLISCKGPIRNGQAISDPASRDRRVVVEDSQGCVCILRREDVEVLLEDLCEAERGALSSSTIRQSAFGAYVWARVEGIGVLVSLSPLLVNEMVE